MKIPNRQFLRPSSPKSWIFYLLFTTTLLFTNYTFECVNIHNFYCLVMPTTAMSDCEINRPVNAFQSVDMSVLSDDMFDLLHQDARFIEHVDQGTDGVAVSDELGTKFGIERIRLQVIPAADHSYCIRVTPNNSAFSISHALPRSHLTR